MLTKKQYANLEPAEYMIDDVLVEAKPILFGLYCEEHEFVSNQYDADQEGYSVNFGIFQFVFIPRTIFESIAIKSDY